MSDRYERSTKVRRHKEEPRSGPIEGLKCKIPPFLGDGNVETYLEWETKMDQNLECFEYELTKVRLVTFEFGEYTLVWWNQFVGDGKDKERERPRKNNNLEKGSVPSQGQKEEATPPNLSSSRSSSIKCFKCFGKGHIVSQCSNRRTLDLRDDGHIESESSHEASSSCSEVEFSSESSHYERDLLMGRRLMSSLVGKDSDSQRKNIFHSRCLVM
ncbi:hypothetical protein CR513_42592, partial [Mucuna pruriens]